MVENEQHEENDDSYDSLPNFFLVNDEENSEYMGPRTPWTPCKRTPFIKIKVEAKNLERSVKEYSNELNNPYQIQLSSYCTISLNKESYTTKEIFHTSPKWRQEYELEITNEATDKILVEIYTSGIFQNVNNKGERNVPISTEPTFLGFQLLPLVFLEKSNQIGIQSSICLKLINKKPTEFFIEGEESILSIDNHNPVSYLVTDSNDISPYIKMIYTFMTAQAMTLINCTVYSVIQREDTETSQHFLVYKLFIKRLDELEWFKEVTLEEIEKFRTQMSECSKDILDIPFPTKSMFSYIPFIGKYYENDDNNGINKKIKMLEFFFSEICRNTLLYKLEEFNDFFSETAY